jgi:hypothetical protein
MTSATCTAPSLFSARIALVVLCVIILSGYIVLIAFQSSDIFLQSASAEKKIGVVKNGAIAPAVFTKTMKPSSIVLMNVEWLKTAEVSGDAETNPASLVVTAESVDEECCYIVRYTPGSIGKAGLAYVADKSYDLSNANRVVFSAKGEKGGETIRFAIAGRTLDPQSGNAPTDTFKNVKFAGVTQDVVLGSDWKKYQISIDGLDLTSSAYPFGFIVKKGTGPESVAFSLRDVTYDTKAAKKPLPLDTTDADVAPLSSQGIQSNSTGGNDTQSFDPLQAEASQGNDSDATASPNLVNQSVPISSANVTASPNLVNQSVPISSANVTSIDKIRPITPSAQQSLNKTSSGFEQPDPRAKASSSNIINQPLIHYNTDANASRVTTKGSTGFTSNNSLASFSPHLSSSAHLLNGPLSQQYVSDNINNSTAQLTTEPQPWGPFETVLSPYSSLYDQEQSSIPLPASSNTGEGNGKVTVEDSFVSQTEAMESGVLGASSTAAPTKLDPQMTANNLTSPLFTSDISPPDTAILSVIDSNTGLNIQGGEAVESSSAIMFTFEGADNMAVSAYQCGLDSLPVFPCSSPVIFDENTAKGLETINVADGTSSHTFLVSAVDTSGNVDASQAAFSWITVNNSESSEALPIGDQQYTIPPTDQQYTIPPTDQQYTIPPAQITVPGPLTPNTIPPIDQQNTIPKRT